ncbi:helix-turn-helix transcriptional regulator [Campylobacter sp. 9BO]|uniref:hypothetical protein n=1 Tax=Campylobacter sp. 9BO TaxID=3424759 RepID=UPI003D345592
MADEKEIYYDKNTKEKVVVLGKYADRIVLETPADYANYSKIVDELEQKVSVLFGHNVKPTPTGAKHIEFKDTQGNLLYVLEWHYSDENIVKRVCRELGITQRELAERIGMSADSLNVAVSNNKFSKQTEAALNLILEVERQKKELEKYENLKQALKNAIL